jgi:aminopeptidase YwaD
LLTEQQRQAIFQEISGVRAQDLIAQLSTLHRLAGSREILKAMNIIREEFEAAGLEQIRLERFPIDGDHSYWTWDTPYIWEEQDAHLTIVSPESERKLIARFWEAPISLLGGSSSTGTGGWQGELVDVGRGETAEDYARAGRRVRGRLVLAHGNPAQVHQQAVARRGAAGMLLAQNPSADPDHPDKITSAWLPLSAAREHPFFGFTLSQRQLALLRDALARLDKKNETLRLSAAVKARFRTGQYRVLSGLIRGTERPREELILVAHICHPKPSANDNASGCALLAEMARTLRVLQRNRTLPRFRRSLRFLVLPEWRGTVPWLHRHRRQTKNMLGVISLDMVGEDQAKCGSTLLVGSTHGVQQHFGGELLARAFRWVASQKSPSKLRKNSLFRWRTEPYFGGTDHMPFVDPTIGVPGLYVGNLPDHFWHTSEDTPDKTDPNTLEWVGTASLIFAYDLLNLTERERESVLAENYLAASRRLATVGQELVEKTHAFVPERNKGLSSWHHFCKDHRQRREKIDYELEVERAVLFSCADGLRGRDRRILAGMAMEFGELLGWQAAEIHGLLQEAYDRVLDQHRIDGTKLRRRRSALERRADGLVPERTFPGPFPMTRLMDKAAKRDRRWLAEMFITLYQQHLLEIPFFFIDGERTALEVKEKLEHEYGPVALEIFMEYLQVLRRARLIRLHKVRAG